jgi:hypothetical protein
MKDVITNPYLPAGEYVPDGEPHIFGDRLYIYGSHDKARGAAYCEQDYVVWSAPVDDLSDWECHGTVYRKEQDPHNKEEMRELWAPDVCRGSDGRYYLYYCRAFALEIGVAVSDTPCGPFVFYDYVRDGNEQIWDRDLPFDPSVLFEDAGHIWLYSGFGADPMPAYITEDILRMTEPFKSMTAKVMEAVMRQVEAVKKPSENCVCLRLAPDMKTVICSNDVIPVKRNAQGTTFEEHPFFEASSIRKIGGLYYLVYSSFQGHELCYATSDFPDRGFVYRGVIISNGDLGFCGNTKARAYYANNHGGLVEVSGQWYIFYHRHTNNTQFSRQGCAEPIRILADGSIPQVEMTSGGLYVKPLPVTRTYSSHICCNLMEAGGAAFIDAQNGMPISTPFITEEGTGTAQVRQYVHNMKSGVVCGVKYLEFDGEDCVALTLRGNGTMEIALDSEDVPAISSLQTDCLEWTEYEARFPPLFGVHAVYFKSVHTDSYIDFSEFRFSCFCPRSIAAN